MTPAFRSSRGAAAFAAILAAFLGLPFALRAVGRPTTSDTYRSMRTTSGPYAWIEKQTLEERSTVDLAFVGPSFLWAGIDTPLVQSALSQALGRPAVVRSLTFNWWGEDLTYTVLRDLLMRRPVKTVVMMLPNARTHRDTPHPMAYRFLALGHGSEALPGLPTKDQIQLLGEFVLGAPRHLLSVVRADPEEAPPARDEATLGAMLAPVGYLGAPFVPDDRDTEPASADELVYSPDQQGWFHFSGAKLGTYESHFVHLMLELLKQKGVNVIFLHVPLFEERKLAQVEELRPWPSELGMGSLVGIPPTRLFRGLTDREIEHFYKDSHLNANGARRFTRAIWPALLRHHDDHAPS